MARRPARLADAAPVLLLRAAAAALKRQAEQEWRAGPFGQRALSGPRPVMLAATPRDFRPTNAEIGRAILAGNMVLAGATLELGETGDPWDRPSPSRRFATELHRFSWLPGLLGCGEAGARAALRLVLDWRILFERINPFVWSSETLERRVFNLACAIKRLSAVASDAETSILLNSLARQARFLSRLDESPARAAERAAVCAVAGAALAGRAGERLLAQNLPGLSRALSDAVLPDGGLKSRSPQQGLELLFDLLTLDDALLQRGREAPDAITRAIDRLTSALRFFTLGDGRLASFQGGEASDAERVRAAMVQDESEARPYGYAPHTGYHRLSGRTLEVIVDAAPPAEGPWSIAACAQPLAIEIACGADRLIANAGWSPNAAAPQALRLTAAGCTAVLEDASAGRPLVGFLARALGPRLVGGASRVEARRNEAEDGVWLETSHDGWAEAYGLRHERRLFVDARLDELRGEDAFTPSRTKPGRRRGPTPFTVRFHVCPDVQVSLARDKRSVILRGPSNKGWWFRNDASDVTLEPSVHLENGLPRRSLQVVLSGEVPTEGTARIRWKLTPVEAPPPKPAAPRTSEAAPLA